MEAGMKERPKCFGCEAPAYLIIGRRAYCGNCAVKIQKMQSDEQEEKIKRMLNNDSA